MATWSYPGLGTFRFDQYRWAGGVTLPAFKVFRYRFRGRNVGRSKLPLQFESDDAEVLPSKAAVGVAEKIVRNEEALVPRIQKALFDDLSGKGPNSGMWWRGGIETILEDFLGESGPLKNVTLERPDDLARLLGSPSICIRESGYGYDKPLATICFEAAFEIEHGIGILTNGTKIVGTGYQMDASPFS